MKFSRFSVTFLCALLLAAFLLPIGVHAKSVSSGKQSHFFATPAALTEAVPSAKKSSSVTPTAIVVWCSLPHDVELWNNDGEWCILGPKYVNFARVLKITNTHGSTIIISDNTLLRDIPLPAGQTAEFNSDNIVYLSF